MAQTEKQIQNPIAHPGEWFKRRVLQKHSISMAAAARRLKISRNQLIQITSAKANVTPNIAARLEIATGIAATFWLNMQAKYSLWELQHSSELKDVERFKEIA